VPSVSTTISCRLVLVFIALFLVPSRIVADTGGDPVDGAREPGVLPLAARWSVDLGGPPVARAAPVIDETRVYVALRAGQIVARNLSDGAELWRKELSTEHPMASDGGVAFVSSRDAIYALAGADGATLWEAPVAGITAPLVARSGWLIALAERRVLAFRAKDGTLIWQRDIGASTRRPAIDGDRLYVSLDDGRIVASDISTGNAVWETTLGGPAGAVFAAGDRVYAGGADRQFYCLKADNGEIDWVKRIGAATVGAATADDARVYFLALDNVMRALDRSNGNQRWQRAVRRRASTGPALGGKYVFVASSSSPEIWMWTADGRPAGSLTLPAESAVPPAFAERGTGGLDVVAVTGSLSSQWQLTLLAKADEPPLTAFVGLPGTLLEHEPLSSLKK
jgi:outer membrane protein assembly factor BamB